MSHPCLPLGLVVLALVLAPTAAAQEPAAPPDTATLATEPEPAEGEEELVSPPEIEPEAEYVEHDAAPLEPHEEHPPEHSPEARIVPHDDGAFSPDPVYEDKPYDAAAQVAIYGGKHMNPTQRPLLELGRRLYDFGPFQPAPIFLGEKNPMAPQLMIFGDLRTAVASNDNGKDERGSWRTRLNLDVDLKLTATERIHAFFRPLDKNGDFSGSDFSGENKEDELFLDGNVDALFFEGDLGSIVAGVVGNEQNFDLPFAAGLIPLLFQNGIWVEDAFTGAAFTIPARNSKLLDISNFDLTFFGGFDNVTTPAFAGDDRGARIYGVTGFLELWEGYMELGYAYLQDKDHLGRDYHNSTISFTRRYRNWFSNSVRVVVNSGQNPDVGDETADGFVFLIENSLITSKPSNVVPYLNMWGGWGSPQSVARDAGAGGILKNTGITFETDGLTGFPKLDDSAQDTFGLALGLNLLSDAFDQQLVVETSFVNAHGGSKISGNQYAIGFRFQRPLTNALILRLDGIWGFLQDVDDIRGLRFELRYKF